jgi:hypothetical protein
MSSIKKFRKLIESQDLFGHVIHLNFDRSGIAHQNLIGGIISSIIKTWMAYFVYYNFKKMLLHEDTKTYNDLHLVDLKELGIVDYNKTDQFIFFTLMKQLENWRGVYLNETDLANYIEVGFF